MATLIDRDKCQERIFRFADRLVDWGYPKEAKAVRAVAKGIKLEKTVDAVPVVHGHWDEDHWEYVCSCCQKHFTDELPWISHPEYGMPNYCPNCGADMRERKDNEYD